MDNKISLHEGEILRILIRRAGLKVDDVAPKLGLLPNSLSRLFKSERITKKNKAAAARILGVDISVFEEGLAYKPPVPTFDVVREPDVNTSAIMEENERLKEENRRMAEELLRERALSEDLRKALLLIAGKGGG